MKKTVFAMLLTLVLVFSLIGAASAVTDGELDGDGHPAVVLILMEVEGEPMYRCSGTLIDPVTVLTAGHCTYNEPGVPYSGIRIFAEADVQSDTTYPYAGGPNTVEATSWYVHPLFPTGSFVLHDVGVIKLSEPVVLPLGKSYGQLPYVGQLDALKTKRGLQDLTFTAVGYGLQKSYPDAAYWLAHNVKVRMVAYPKLLQINVPGFTGDYSLLLSNNANTGGTCFGDSGGPNFIGNSMTIGGVTSFGINGNCAGTGGVFRLDKADVLSFIANPETGIAYYPIP
jgi:secreted trypsin-like serine protease